MRIGKLLIRSGIAVTLVTVVARAFGRVEVAGDSMRPALEPGDHLLLVRTRPKLGDVVALPDPRNPARMLVKRVAAVDGEGLTVRGDNAAASTDSRSFGAVPLRSVRGVAWYRYSPADRAGRVRP